jgi:hypothetical protein
VECEVSAPTADPILLRILSALCVPLRMITQANGFYYDVAGVDIEPEAFNNQDSYPLIVVEEESGEISDSSESGYQDEAIVAFHGFLKTSNAATAYAEAHRFAADMKRIAKSITRTTFDDGAGGSLVRNWSINQKHEIVKSDLAEGFLEVIVRVSLDYRDFSPPVPGI